MVLEKLFSYLQTRSRLREGIRIASFLLLVFSYQRWQIHHMLRRRRAFLYFLQGDHARFYEEINAVLKALPSDVEIAACNGLLALYEDQVKGNLFAALSYNQSAIEYQLRVRNIPALIRLYVNRAAFLRSDGDIERASQSLQKAEQLLGQKPDRRVLVNVLWERARIERALHNERDALRLLEQAWTIAEYTPFLNEKGDLRREMGRVHQALKNMRAAKRHFDAAVEFYAKGGYIDKVASTRHEAGGSS